MSNPGKNQICNNGRIREPSAAEQISAMLQDTSKGPTDYVACLQADLKKAKELNKDKDYQAEAAKILEKSRESKRNIVQQLEPEIQPKPEEVVHPVLQIPPVNMQASREEIAAMARAAIDRHCQNLRGFYDQMFDKMAALQLNRPDTPSDDEGVDDSDDEDEEESEDEEDDDDEHDEDDGEVIDEFNMADLVDDEHFAAFHRLVYEMAYGNRNNQNQDDDPIE